MLQGASAKMGLVKFTIGLLTMSSCCPIIIRARGSYILLLRLALSYPAKPHRIMPCLHVGSKRTWLHYTMYVHAHMLSTEGLHTC